MQCVDLKTMGGAPPPPISPCSSSCSPPPSATLAPFPPPPPPLASFPLTPPPHAPGWSTPPVRQHSSLGSFPLLRAVAGRRSCKPPIIILRELLNRGPPYPFIKALAGLV